jgi:tryptophan synthase beta chain
MGRVPSARRHCRRLPRSGAGTPRSVTDDEALDAFQFLARTEGILPALESAHAVAWLRREAETIRPDSAVIVNLSGRGDKDVHHASAEIARRSGA